MAPFSPLPGSSNPRAITTPSKPPACSHAHSQAKTQTQYQFRFGAQSRFPLLFGQALPQHYQRQSQGQSRIPQPTFYPQSHKPTLHRKEDSRLKVYHHFKPSPSSSSKENEKQREQERHSQSHHESSQSSQQAANHHHHQHASGGPSMFEYDTISLAVLLCMFVSTLWLVATFTSASAFATLAPSPSAGFVNHPLLSSSGSSSAAAAGGRAVGSTHPAEFVEASIWGEVGLYELKEKSHKPWRRIRAGGVHDDDLSHESEAHLIEHEQEMPAVGKSKSNSKSMAMAMAIADSDGIKDGGGIGSSAVRMKRNEAVLEALSNSQSGNKKDRKGKKVIVKPEESSDPSTKNNNSGTTSGHDDLATLHDMPNNLVSNAVAETSGTLEPRFSFEHDQDQDQDQDNNGHSSLLTIPSPSQAAPTDKPTFGGKSPHTQTLIEERRAGEIEDEDKMTALPSSGNVPCSIGAESVEGIGMSSAQDASAGSPEEALGKLERRHRKHRQKQDQPDIGL
ncbi:hypothetical protein IAU59_000476 [Kwoniella sp. CBS 9459]